MNTIATQTFKTPFGELLMGVFKGRLCLCDWRRRKMRARIDRRVTRELHASYEEGENTLFDLVRNQLEEYFRRERTRFEVPLLMVGTDFQKRIWNALLQIPHGETRGYAQLARQAGSPAAIRAVGCANGANALSILVPCHRVIGTHGALVGYAGGMRVKQQLLHLERDLFF